jgi:hypothetical protein
LWGIPQDTTRILDLTPYAKLRARRQRDAAQRRSKRAAARQAKTAKTVNGGNGAATSPTAEALWAHAEQVRPKMPWRAALNTASRVHKDLPAAVAVVALVDLAADILLASGILWRQPDLIASMRTLTNDLERRRDAEPPRGLLERRMGPHRCGHGPALD